MSNNRNLGNIATAITNATSGQVLTSQGSGVATFADAGGTGVTVHTNQAAMLTDAASADEGSLHYENANNKLYVKQSSGFFLLASITNTAPTVSGFTETTGSGSASAIADNGTFVLTSGSNTVITLTATDPDLETLVYSATVTSGTASNVISSPSLPISNQSGNTFTLVPQTSGSGGTVTIRFDVSDGNNVVNKTQSFSLSFIGNWLSGVTAHSAPNPSGGQDFVDLDASGDRMSIVDYENKVSIYKRSGSSWSLEQTINPRSGWDVNWDLGYGSGSRLSDDGDLFCWGGRGYPAATLDIYRRSGTTWSFEASISNGRESSPIVSRDGTRIMAGGVSNNFYVYAYNSSTSSWTTEFSTSGSFGSMGSFNDKDFNSDSTKLIVGEGTTNTVRFYTRSGTTYTLDQTITGGSGTVSSNYYSSTAFGQATTISGDGLTCAIYQKRETNGGAVAGRVYIYNRTSLSSNFNTTPIISFTPSSSGVAVGETGFGEKILLDDTGTKLMIQSNLQSYIAELSSGTWSISKQLNTPLSSGISAKTAGVSGLSRSGAMWAARSMTGGVQVWEAG